MNTETINTQLYEKMFAEQERYRDWLLHQPPEEILNPVSYTHLDVYKRQMQNEPPAP